NIHVGIRFCNKKRVCFFYILVLPNQCSGNKNMKLTTIEQVQKRVGMLPAPRDLKVIDHVDEHAKRWLSYVTFAFIAFGKAGDIELTAAGGKRGFVSV